MDQIAWSVQLHLALGEALDVSGVHQGGVDRGAADEIAARAIPSPMARPAAEGGAAVPVDWLMEILRRRMIAAEDESARLRPV